VQDVAVKKVFHEAAEGMGKREDHGEAQGRCRELGLPDTGGD
jgi:hypothetical protein